MIRAIVFDVDNTLLLDPKTGKGSEEVKANAWHEVFTGLPEQVLTDILKMAQQVVAGGKGDRRDVVRIVLREGYGSSDPSQTDIDNVCEEFNRIVQRGIFDLKIDPEIHLVLSTLQKRFSLYINTATPLEPVIEALRPFNLIDYFKKIFGRPGTKEINLLEIIEREGVTPEEILFIDDTPVAADIARRVGCRFIGIRTARIGEWVGAQPFRVINRLGELLEIV